jgi:hypothetical protein
MRLFVADGTCSTSFRISLELGEDVRIDVEPIPTTSVF